jgi:hypothetical protein
MAVQILAKSFDRPSELRETKRCSRLCIGCIRCNTGSQQLLALRQSPGFGMLPKERRTFTGLR